MCAESRLGAVQRSAPKGCAAPIYKYIDCAHPLYAGVGSRAKADARRPPTPQTQRAPNLEHLEEDKNKE